MITHTLFMFLSFLHACFVQPMYATIYRIYHFMAAGSEQFSLANFEVKPYR